MSRDSIAFLADGHITQDDPERIERLVKVLDTLGETCAVVCVLGDLFEVWLGVSEAGPHLLRVGQALARLRAAGVRTIYVEGNRDFAIGRGATSGLFDVVARREHRERFGDLEYHMSHGDLVNPHDWQYRAWRGFAKGLLAPVLLNLLPARTANALAARLEQRLRRTNLRHKGYFPEQACLAFARAQVAAGADVVVVGHFHREVELEAVESGRKGRFLSLPFWHEEARPVIFDRQGRRTA